MVVSLSSHRRAPRTPPRTPPALSEDEVASAEENQRKWARMSSNMEIFISLPTGRTISQVVSEDDYIDLTKVHLQTVGDFTIAQQRLVYAGRELQDGHTYGEYNILGGAVIRLIYGMQIFVKSSGVCNSVFIIECEPSDFIENIKMYLLHFVGCGGNDISQRYELHFNGELLAERTTLATNGVHNLATLQFSCRRGGPSA
jgi:ubiquitin C